MVLLHFLILTFMFVAKNYVFDLDNDDKFETTMLYSTGLMNDIIASSRAF
jgi:hypothetical protein